MKRARRESDAGEPQGKQIDEGERHPSLWLEDGNIIISAKSAETQMLVLFRVHKSILSRQSDVFAGLFSLPDTPENYRDGGSGDVNDVPVVHLQDDAEGITDLLNILYNPLEPGLFSRKRNPDFPLLSRRLLKLADKYHLDVLKNKLIAHFSADWPQTLEEWDILDAAREARERCAEVSERSKWPEDVLPDPIAAAIFAEEAKMEDVLTAVFLDLHRVARTNDWDKPKSDLVIIMKFKGARWSIATTELLFTLLLVQDVLDKLVGYYVRDILRVTDIDLDGGCTALPTCQRLRNFERHKVTERILDSRDPLAVLQSLEQWAKETSSVCESCRTWITTRVPQARQTMWDEVTNVVNRGSD